MTCDYVMIFNKRIGSSNDGRIVMGVESLIIFSAAIINCRKALGSWRLEDSICLYKLIFGLDDRGFESLHGLGILLFTTASRPALEPT
jgi:hypothetical protein